MKHLVWVSVVIVVGLAFASSLIATPNEWTTIAEFQTSLVGRTPNQRHNALLASIKLNGAVIQPGETLSFCKRVGTWSRDQGYRRAPVSYNGQLIDSWGGGVCQTSTTLYNASLLSGLTIVERWPHRYCPSYVSPGRDAAVAYDSVDLKIKNPYDFPISLVARIDSDRIVVRFIAQHQKPETPIVYSHILSTEMPTTIRSELGHSGKIRNGGKVGFQVATLRQWENRKQQVSLDHYPAMNRVVEYRD